MHGLKQCMALVHLRRRRFSLQGCLILKALENLLGKLVVLKRGWSKSCNGRGGKKSVGYTVSLAASFPLIFRKGCNYGFCFYAATGSVSSGGEKGWLRASYNCWHNFSSNVYTH